MALPPPPTLSDRSGGVLLHLTSLPGPDGSGDLGPSAAAFVTWAAEAGLRWWQMLPVGPPGYGNSPYSAHSSFAGSPQLISLQQLADDGLLAAKAAPPRPPGRIDWGATRAHRMRALRTAFASFQTGRRPSAYDSFVAAERGWLEDWALYAAIKESRGGGPWSGWPAPLRLRERGALADARRELAPEIEFHRFCQWLVARQWQRLRQEARRADIALLGDIPI